jgi:toluene monooxygenase electron transfer component
MPSPMRVQLKAGNRTHTFDVRHGESILYAGMRHGLDLPYGCASGTCGSCRVACVNGECVTTWTDAPGLRRDPQRPNELLMCQSTALADSALETDKTIYALDAGACLPDYRRGRIDDQRMLASDMMALSLELDAPFHYDAGQFVALQAPGIVGYRVYSITNFARATRSIGLLVKRKSGGRFSQWVFGPSSRGAEIRLFGPLGRATFSPTLGKNLLIVAGGSGIAGMMSILERATQEGYFVRHRGHVFFGVRSWHDRFYLDEFAAMQDACGERLSITVALSDDDVPECARIEYPQLAFARGLVHDVARSSMPGHYANVRAYVAGPPPAVDAALRYLLRDAKLSPSDIRYDKFG